MDDYINKLEIVQNLKDYEERRARRSAELDTLKNIKDEAVEVQKSLSQIFAGKAFTDSSTSKVDQSKAKANAIASIGLDGLLMEAITIEDPGRRKKAMDAIADKLGDDINKLSPVLAQRLRDGDISGVLQGVMDAGEFTANIKEVEDQIANFSTTLVGKSAVETRVFLDSLVNTAEGAVELGNSLGLTTDVVEQLNKAFEGKGGIDAYIQSLKDVETETQRIADGRHLIALDTVATSRQSGALASQTGLDRTADLAVLDLAEKRNNLQAIYNENTEQMDEAQQANHQRRVIEALREIELAEKKAEVAKVNATDIGQLGKAVGDSLTSSMQSAFDGLIQGTMSAKDAFASMAQSMLQSIAKVISELLVAKLLTSALGVGGPLEGFGKFLGIDNRYGGVMSGGSKAPGYALGGVAKGPQAGYPAILHGTEAIVPLPNGKSIPVDMKGAGQQNNVTVNVAIDKDGNAKQDSQADSNDGANLGTIIAGAVQKELLNQKRAGGILNPMGV